MKVIYFSLTGNCKRFVERCKIPVEDVLDLWEVDYDVDFDYILVTPTIGFGKVPDDVITFLEQNGKHLVGVVGSGNKNWGNRFAKASETISEQYNVPLLMKIELHGNTRDLIKFKKIYLESTKNGKI
ncbi:MULTISPECIES: class Ib ribonucleoside-diphosphate reductase assembly flavoprotein NrdI [Gemella]|uniref:class Ib ribonucleoside-diphosphate reductase assembly flavoprotein NrdI n=1 Tax=Gemella TaxID=1378 RepID=UPI000931FFDA|nr:MULTISPECIES: class Ib ribonucleoside-diphosphate reductase assembly flavoprotein NrdI [Gemella]AXI26596.1 class Ib ribonucleoside-diphosphate reductase assembly flavoprotein NrdI [Gemella sp. ND 6198]